ncbi:MAG: DUF4824 family protein [Acidobacteriota bacterium]|nr:DUF4824 family protein [Acidobacteriota bacterium]
MRRYGMMLAILLLIAVNAFVLAGVAYNRSGEPLATITLTEREIPLASYGRYSDRENTGLSLRLDSTTDWFMPDGFYNPANFLRSDEIAWFNQAKLESIGFDCSLPLNAPNAELHYGKMLPRKTYVVLEYAGPAWEAWLSAAKKRMADAEMRFQSGDAAQAQLDTAREDFDRQLRTRSRLFIVDAGNDPDGLRKQYSPKDRYLILPARVRLRYHGAYKESGKEIPPRLEGQISDVLVDTIYVPKGHRAILEKILNDPRNALDAYDWHMNRKRDPAYEVMLHAGKRHEPWIAAIREIASR